MMTQEFDPKKSYLCLKAHEKMIAYVSFVVRFKEDAQGKEGILKISSFRRPYGGGCITLTFIVDTQDNQELKDHLRHLFTNLTSDSLRPYLGKDMDKVVKVSLDALEEIPQWYIEEVSVHFSRINVRENVLIEEQLIPALESSLSFCFDPVEWWPPDKPLEMPEDASLTEYVSLKSLFRRWFKA